MSQQLGKVTDISGDFFAKEINGNIVKLNQGDSITQDMLVYGDAGNTKASLIKISLSDGSEIVLSKNEEQMFDSSLANSPFMVQEGLALESVNNAIGSNLSAVTLEETAAGEEELLHDESIQTFAMRDGAMTNIESDLRDAAFLDAKNKDITEEETAEGDEEVEDEGEGNGEFAARDGNATDIVSDLRKANFKARTQTYEDRDQFKTESESRLSKIDNRDENSPFTSQNNNTPTLSTPILSQTTSTVDTTPLFEAPIVSTPTLSTPPVAQFIPPTTPPTPPVSVTPPVEAPIAPPTPVEPPVTPPTSVEPEIPVEPPVEPEIEVPVVPPAPPAPSYTIIKIVAADSTGAPLKDGDNNYIIVNETPEGGKAYYVALAFKPNTTVFNDASKLTTQEGTVDFTFTDGTATRDTSVGATEGTNDYKTQTTGITTIALGTAVSIDALDDYIADNGEKFTVTISNYAPASPSTYGATTINSAAVTTTITDNTGKPNDIDPLTPAPIETTSEDTVVKLIAVNAAGNAIDASGALLANGAAYVFTNSVPEGNLAYYKALAFDSSNITFTKGSELSLQLGSVTVSSADNNLAPVSKVDATAGSDYTAKSTTVALNTAFSVTTLDDYIADNNETFTVNIGTYVEPTTGDKYENVTASGTVTTKILDNTTAGNETGTTRDTDPVKIVLVAVTSAATTIASLTDGTTGVLNITKTNETPEGGKLYYMAVAVDSDGKPLVTQGGTVNLEYTDTTTTKGTDYDHTIKTSTTIGTVFEVLAKDDYFAEGNETFTVKIVGTPPSFYENATIDTTNTNDTVTSTIKDNPADVPLIPGVPTEPTDPNVPTGGNSYGLEDTVYVKITNNASVYEGFDLTHTVTLVDKNGNNVTVPAGETITVTLQYTSTTGTVNDDDFTNARSTTVTISGGHSTTITNKTKDDWTPDNNEVYTLKITNVAQTATGTYEKVAIADSTAPDLIKNKDSVTGTIKDDISMGTANDAYVDEDKFNPAASSSTLVGTIHTKTAPNADGLDATGHGTTGAATKLGITSTLADGRYTLNFEDSIVLKSDTVNDVAITKLGAANFTSGGVEIKYDVSGNTITAYTNAADKNGSKVFVISLSNAGVVGTEDGYTYTQYKNIDHPTGTAEGTAGSRTNDDTLSLEFGFKIKDYNGTKADTSTHQESEVYKFKVFVNDSLPDTGSQTITAIEDTDIKIVLSEESFLGSIWLDNGKDVASNKAVDETLNIYDADKNDIVGKITVNNDGTVTFTTNIAGATSHYSGDTFGFTYTGISDYDGDKATGSVAISVKPVSDAPTITIGTAETWEDESIKINLHAPVVTDNTDKNNTGGATLLDYPEKLGLISLYNMATGVQILNSSDASLWTSTGTTSKLYILLSDGQHTADTISSFVIDANHITMSTSDFEALKVNPVAQSHLDIDIKMSVTEYEVDASGNKLSNTSTEGNNGSQTTQTFHVEVKAVTDNINLSFDTDTVNTVKIGDITTSGGRTAGDTFTYSVALTEGANNIIDLQAILSATAGGTVDLTDKSEGLKYLFENIPEGTIITLGNHTATAGSDGKATIIFASADYIADPILKMTLPEQFGGAITAKISLIAKDTDSDSSGHTPATITKVVYFNATVAQVADIATLQVAQSVGLEDAGRENGNLSNDLAVAGLINKPEDGIALNIKVSSEDKDGSEKFTVRIDEIPDGASLHVWDNGTSAWVLVNNIAGTTGNITVAAGTTAGTYKVTILDYQNDKLVKFIPPHNSDADYTLKVNAQTVDGTSTWNDGFSTVTDKEIKVIVNDVADVPVGTELKELMYKVTAGEVEIIAGVVTGSGTGTYAYLAVEDTLMNFKDFYADSSKLASYDGVDAETLSIAVELPTGFNFKMTGDGTFKIVDGKYVFKASDINNVQIGTPANFSGDANLKVSYITTDHTDSKTHAEETIKIFVAPQVEADIVKTTTGNEDAYFKVDFGMVYKNGDDNETLGGVKILASDVDGKAFALYSDNAGTKTQLSTKTNISGVEYYVLDANQANSLYAKNTTEHKPDTATEYNFKFIYTIKDTVAGVFHSVDSAVTEYSLNIKPATDTPTLTLSAITGATANVDLTSGISIKAGEVASFTLPVTTTSPDKDSSETVTKIVISGVPEGVTIDGAVKQGVSGSSHNGIWIITPSGDAATKLDIDGAIQNIKFNFAADANYEVRDIKITTYTKDAGDAEVLNASTTITVVKDYTGTGTTAGDLNITLGQQAAIIYEDNNNGTDDVIYNIGKSVTVAGSGLGAYTINLSGFAVGTKVNGVDITTTSQVVQVAGTGNAADVMTALSNVLVTPPANSNTGGANDISMNYTATITAGTLTSSVVIAETVIPVTDKLTITIATTPMSEDVASDISITLANPNDGSKTVLIGNSMTIQVTETWADDVPTAGATTGTLTSTNTDYVVTGGPGTYTVTSTAGFPINTAITGLKYTPATDRDGEVKFEVTVQNKEGDSFVMNSTAEATIKVTAVVDAPISAITVTVTGTGTEDTDTDTIGLKNPMKLVIDGYTPSTDNSEKLGNIILDEVPNGFVVYYMDGTLKMAMNIGKSGTGTFDLTPNISTDTPADNNKWLVPVKADGTMPQIYINAPDNWSGNVPFKAIFTAQEQNLSTLTTATVNVTGNIIPVADAVTIDPTLTFGNAFGWVDLKLNANMTDVDGSEVMNLTITGLGQNSQFKLFDGTTDTAFVGTGGAVGAAKAVYADVAGVGTWTLTGVKFDQINNIKFTNDKSVAAAALKVSASTSEVDAAGNVIKVNEVDLTSTPTADKGFELKLSNIAGDFKLDKGVSLDFDKIGAISTDATTLKGVSKIDLTADGANKILNLTLQDVLDMSTSKEIKITGIAGDEVSFKDGTGNDTWTKGSTVTESSKTFDVYTNAHDSSVKVKVEQAITDSIV